MITGTADPLTPNYMAHELAGLAIKSCRKHVYDVQDGTHNALYRTDIDYWHVVRKFIDQ